MSTRLHFIVEGQTEETFVNRVLVPHLATQLIWGKARCVMTSRKRSIIYRGGLRSYAQAKKDIVLWMKEDQNPDAFFTTMFDLYALPSDFPDYDVAKRLENPHERVARLEEAMGQDINHPRFIPYLQLHEFEALLLADPQKMEWEYPEHNRAIYNLLQMAGGFISPELIDDGENTAPSKRIIREIPEYEGMKASAGPLTAERIGLPVLRGKCEHFSGWISRLERVSHGEHP
jgi:hypothetical protein